MLDRQAPEDETIAALIERVSTEDPDRIALLAPGREPLGYGELAALLASTVVALRDREVGPRDRVALVVENGPEAATGFLALAGAAAVAPLNPAYRREELDFYLDDLGVRAVVVSRAVDSPVREAAPALGAAVFELEAVAGAAAGTFRLDGAAPSSAACPAPDLGDVALLLHTSGTTSRPKLVPLTHRNLTASSRNVAASLDLRPDDRCLNLMPLFHVHGLVAALLASLRAGASVACTPGFHALRAFEWIRELEPTWMTAVPTMYQSLLGRADDHEELLRSHRLRFVRSSSAALPLTVLERLEQKLGVPVVEAYGMTEAAHQMASNGRSQAARRPGSVGRPAGPEIAILSPGGETLPAGSRGEVAIRGANVFAGYDANPEATAAAFVAGWFRTGDEGAFDEDGFLTLTGRLKEQINRGGEKISPLEVDDRLLAHPAVAQAVTFAIPDERLGEEVAAVVVLEAGAEADEIALQDFAAQTLAPFKVPRTIVLADEIPKGPTGKVQRSGLAERLGASAAPVELNGRRAPRTVFELLIAQTWADVLGVPAIAVDDDFFALGGDSILGAEAVARLREVTGRHDLPLVSIVRAPTVAGMARELDRDVAALSRSGAVRLDPAATGPPFFIAHGGDGEVLEFVALARFAGQGCAVYGLRARGIDDGEDPRTSIEEMAADYLESMRSVQPHGPYRVGGFCVGSLVALELAHRLVAAGEPVSLLVLVDPRVPRPKTLRYAAWLTLFRARHGGRGRTILRRMAGRGQPPAPVEDARSEAQAAISRAREAYEPQPYSGPSLIVRGHSGEIPLYDIPDWYLGHVFPASRTVRLGFDHTGLLRPAGAAAVARELLAAFGSDGAA